MIIVMGISVLKAVVIRVTRISLPLRAHAWEFQMLHRLHNQVWGLVALAGVRVCVCVRA